ncbi:MAG: DUF5666 domain-containing protein [Chloroflexota bacterium]
MLKKIGLLFLVVVIGSLAMSGAALADEGTPGAGGPARAGKGEVVAVAADNFTVENPKGEQRVVYVDSATEFTTKEGEALTLADLKVGDHVAGKITKHDDGKLYATTVVVLPPRTDYKGVGVVNSVDDDEFSFTNRRGKDWDFYVDAGTKFSDRTGTLAFSDLKAGSNIFVQAELRSDGKWWATEVKIKPARPTATP